MPAQSSQLSLKKAKLFEIKFQPNNPQPVKVNGDNDVEVQFNPQTLKLTYSNENKSGDKPVGSTPQFVGAGTSKLAIDLLFDTTQTGTDVRYWTAKVGYFIKPSPQANKKTKRAPPAVSFEWGSFTFQGVLDSLQETLDYFSEDGVPLRASLSIGISGIDSPAPDNGASGYESGSGQPGQTPLNPARAGDSVASMAAANGNSGNWKSIAAANNIDDPLHLPTGTLLDLSAGASGTAGVSLTASGSADAGFSAGIGAGVGFSAGASVGASAGASLGAGVGASLGTSARANAAGSVGGSFGISAAASGGIQG